METTMLEKRYLDNLLERVSQCIRGEAERALLEIRADEALQKRIDDLAEKCDEGSLSPKERTEYESYVRFGNSVAILQAKARKHLSSKVD